MNDIKLNKIGISGTALQGMMMGNWETGAVINLSGQISMHCLDGRVWEVRGRDNCVLGTINPTAAVTCKDLAERLLMAVESDGTQGMQYYQQSESAESAPADD
jgi:hypothetical protein